MASGSRLVERCAVPRTGGCRVPAVICVVLHWFPHRRASRHTATRRRSLSQRGTAAARPTPTAAYPSEADGGDDARRRHSDGVGVRSDNGDADRSRQTRGKPVLVKRCRPTRLTQTLPSISMFCSVHVTDHYQRRN